MSEVGKAVLVTGSRNWRDRERLEDFLYAAGPELVVHGAARGADSMADEWARDNGVYVVPMPAQWEAHGKAAGRKRNEEMCDLMASLKRCGWEVEVLAFPLPESVGTLHCMRYAQHRGLDVHDVRDHMP